MNKFYFFVLIFLLFLGQIPSLAGGKNRNPKREAKAVRKQLKKNIKRGESINFFDYRGEYFNTNSISPALEAQINTDLDAIAEMYNIQNLVLVISKPGLLKGSETTEEIKELNREYVRNFMSEMSESTVALLLLSTLTKDEDGNTVEKLQLFIPWTSDIDDTRLPLSNVAGYMAEDLETDIPDLVYRFSNYTLSSFCGLYNHRIYPVAPGDTWLKITRTQIFGNPHNNDLAVVHYAKYLADFNGRDYTETDLQAGEEICLPSCPNCVGPDCYAVPKGKGWVAMARYRLGNDFTDILETTAKQIAEQNGRQDYKKESPKAYEAICISDVYEVVDECAENSCLSCHRVISGQTLTSIAELYEVELSYGRKRILTVEEIKNWNTVITDPNNVAAGTILCLHALPRNTNGFESDFFDVFATILNNYGCNTGSIFFKVSHSLIRPVAVGLPNEIFEYEIAITFDQIGYTVSFVKPLDNLIAEQAQLLKGSTRGLNINFGSFGLGVKCCTSDYFYPCFQKEDKSIGIPMGGPYGLTVSTNEDNYITFFFDASLPKGAPVSMTFASTEFVSAISISHDDAARIDEDALLFEYFATVSKIKTSDVTETIGYDGQNKSVGTGFLQLFNLYSLSYEETNIKLYEVEKNVWYSKDYLNNYN